MHVKNSTTWAGTGGGGSSTSGSVGEVDGSVRPPIQPSSTLTASATTDAAAATNPLYPPTSPSGDNPLHHASATKDSFTSATTSLVNLTGT